MKVSSIVKRMSFVDEIAILALDSENEVHTVFSGNRNEVPWFLMIAKIAKQNVEDDAPTIGIWHKGKKNIDTLFIMIEDPWGRI
jgi:hypothetical protein